MSLAIEISNLKCGGCANTIERQLRELTRVTDVVVNTETSQVVVSGSGLSEETVAALLTRLGYPPQGFAAGRGRSDGEGQVIRQLCDRSYE